MCVEGSAIKDVNLNPDVFGDNRLKGFEGAFSIEFVIKDGLFASDKGF